MRCFLIAAALGLAACDKPAEVDLTNATPAEVAKAIKDSGATRTMVRPGKWASTVAILEMNSPGMPPEMQQQMAGKLGQPRTVEACLTPDQVDNPERMIGNVPPSCRYQRYTMGNGKMAGTMRCDTNGMVQEMSVSGTYSDDRYSLVIDNKTIAPQGAVAGQPAASMSMKMKVDSRRLGDCDPAPAAAPANPGDKK